MHSGRRRLAVLGLAAVVVVGTSACGDDDGGGDSVFTLGVGQCFDDPGSGGEVDRVPTVPCEEPHQNEVFAVFALEAGEYPGEDEVTALAEEGCVERFPDYVGSEYETSELFVNYLYPLEDAWNEIDDRTVVCFAFLPDDTPLEGSMKGSGR